MTSSIDMLIRSGMEQGFSNSFAADAFDAAIDGRPKFHQSFVDLSSALQEGKFSYLTLKKTLEVLQEDQSFLGLPTAPDTAFFMVVYFAELYEASVLFSHLESLEVSDVLYKLSFI